MPDDHVNPACTEARDIIGIALAAAQPHELEPGKYYAVATANGQVEEIDLTTDEYRDYPRRIDRKIELTDVRSLTAYWDKFATAASECYADADSALIKAVIDAHSGVDHNPDFPADWCQHIATCKLTLSAPLSMWLANNNKPMGQERFAEWVEDHITFIVSPPASDLMELAESFQATSTAKFQSGFRVRDGQRRLAYIESNEASMRGGELPVPTAMTLALPIWRGDTETTTFTARIRYRPNTPEAGKLSICYILDRPDDIIADAFRAAVATVTDHIGRPVFAGSHHSRY
jgi:uncharacterized protein YfdQ (DUF2303 family)